MTWWTFLDDIGSYSGREEADAVVDNGPPWESATGSAASDREDDVRELLEEHFDCSGGTAMCACEMDEEVDDSVLRRRRERPATAMVV